MRFPCLQGLHLQPSAAARIIVSCAILHNIAISQNDINDVPEAQDDGDCLRPDPADLAARLAMSL